MTTIAISEEQWKELNNMKNLGEDFSDVVQKLLNKTKQEEFLNIGDEKLS